MDQVPETGFSFWNIQKTTLSIIFFPILLFLAAFGYTQKPEFGYPIHY